MVPGDFSGDRVTPRVARRRFLLDASAVGAAVALTLLATTQNYTSRRIEGLSADLQRMGLRESINWFSWAVLAPILFVVTDTIRRSKLSRGESASLWSGLAIAFMLAHATIEVIAARATGVVPTAMSFATHVVATGTAEP